MAKTATHIKDMVGWQGHASLYKLSEPHAEYNWGDGEPKTYDHVIVSAAFAMFSGPETYIFPAAGPDADEPVSFGEMPGSIRGTMSHAEALANAGYDIVSA